MAGSLSNSMNKQVINKVDSDWTTGLSELSFSMKLNGLEPICGWLYFGNLILLLTAMYGLQPASLVLAMESTSWPLMPKSHSFMLPFLSRRMFDGLMSELRDMAGEKTRNDPNALQWRKSGILLPLCIIFKFSFKWLSAFTVCNMQKQSLGQQDDNQASNMDKIRKTQVQNTYS